MMPIFSSRIYIYTYLHTVVKVDRRIRWHYTTTILRLRIGARLTRYRNCKFHNFARTICRHADGISRYSVPPSAGPLLPLLTYKFIWRQKSWKRIGGTVLSLLYARHCTLLMPTWHTMWLGAGTEEVTGTSTCETPVHPVCL